MPAKKVTRQETVYEKVTLNLSSQKGETAGLQSRALPAPRGLRAPEAQGAGPVLCQRRRPCSFCRLCPDHGQGPSRAVPRAHGGRPALSRGIPSARQGAWHTAGARSRRARMGDEQTRASSSPSPSSGGSWASLPLTLRIKLSRPTGQARAPASPLCCVLLSPGPSQI